MTKRNGFYQCDREFLRRAARDESLSAGAYRLLLAIMSMVRLPGEPVAVSNTQLAAMTGLAGKSISRLRKELEEREYLLDAGCGHRRMKITRLADAALSPQPGIVNSHGGELSPQRGIVNSHGGDYPHGGGYTIPTAGDSRAIIHYRKETKETETQPRFSSSPRDVKGPTAPGDGWRGPPPEMRALMERFRNEAHERN